MSTQTIVSRNINHKEVEAKYQTRSYKLNSPSQPRDYAVLTNVEFKSTYHDEILDADYGFGCQVAAVGVEVMTVPADLVAKLEPVKFQSDKFCFEDNTRLTRTDLFVCTPHGILAVR